MMFDFRLPENASIFLDNLCVYHVFFDLISFVTILFTWWFCKLHNNTNNQDPNDNNEIGLEESLSYTNIKDENYLSGKSQEDGNFADWTDDIVSNIKGMRQKALAKELRSKLTEDELEEEKKVEKMQLEKIFQLLQGQEEKFQMTSMQQLQDQLNLYRL